MSVTLKIAAILQQFTGNNATVEVHGTTVSECLDELIQKYPETRKWLFDANNSPVVWVLVNNEVVLPGDNTKKVKEGDELQLIPMVAGG